MNINVPPDQLSELIGAAVMQTITEERRDTLIQAAVTHLLCPEKSPGFSQGKSPLQEAFDRAVSIEASKIVSSYMAEQQDVGDKIRALIVEAVDHALLGDNRKKLVENMSDAIVKGFKIDRF